MAFRFASPEALTIAVTAVNGACVGGQDQAAIGVTMDETRHGHLPVFFERIVFRARRKRDFPKIGKALPAEGVLLVFVVNE